MAQNSPCTTEEWYAYLSGYSGDYLRAADEDGLARLDEAQRDSGWLGFPGAGEADIASAERRLGVRLPPSYRNFLLVSNGWREIGVYVSVLRPVQEVGWFREVEQPTWELFRNDLVLEHLPDQAMAARMRRSSEEFARHIGRCLALSFGGDDDYWLLDPEQADAGGEWAAYTWSAESPLWEDQSHASFAALVVSAREQFESSRARHGRPVRAGASRVSGELTERGRRAALAGDADAAIAAFESAADGGDRLAPYLSALVRAFTEPRLAHF
ncbi:MAG: SMI1/KNR4 family protein, partial [Trebonia sp.]